MRVHCPAGDVQYAEVVSCATPRDSAAAHCSQSGGELPLPQLLKEELPLPQHTELPATSYTVPGNFETNSKRYKSPYES